MYFIIVLLSFIAATKICVQGLYSRNHIKNTIDIILYNAFAFAFIVLFFLFAFGIQIPSKTTLLYSFIFGFCSFIFQIAYVNALSIGPVSLTVLLANFNLIIPVAMSTFLFNEKPTILQIIGVLLLLSSFILIVNKKDKDKISKKWLLLSLACFFSAGLSISAQKLHQHTQFKNEYKEFIIFAYLIAMILSFLMFFITNKKYKKTIKLDYKFYLSSLIVAILLGAYNTSVLYISGSIKSIILIPILNGGSTIFSTLYGIIVFKDNLTGKQLISLILGILSIVLVSLS